MNIKLTEYIGASTIALNIKDVPMTALPGIKDAFVRLCETVGGVPAPLSVNIHLPEGAVERSRAAFEEAVARELAAQTAGEVMQPVEMTVREVPELINVDTSRQEAEATDKREASSTEDKPRRGRPKKVETVEDKEPAGEPGEHVEAPIAENTSPPTEATSVQSAEPLSDITDSELQKYCAKLAAHFGDPKKVFDLAQPFVPEGAVARPTNIKDNAQRHEFVTAAEAASGVRWFGPDAFSDQMKKVVKEYANG